MCYTAPLIGAVVTSVAWSKTKSVKLWWLNLMFLGGALFGVIDHLWNGELFLISENIVSDMLLGVTITAIILVTWVVMLKRSKVNSTLASYVDIKR
ncbi:MAG: hypothetical protein ABIG92_05930 [Candidatus Omnitrophota bacterium]